MRARLRAQDGAAIVVAIFAMTIMFAIGLATLGFAGGQRQLSVGERVRESSFNLAEAVLNAEAFLLSREWPGSSGSSFPSNCSSGNQSSKCPDQNTLAAQFTGPDYASSSWTAVVQDNGGGIESYYRSDLAVGQPGWDANGDGAVWIRAQARVSGVSRTVIAQMKAQTYSIPFPQNVITAGHMGTTNNGKKVIVDTNGRSYTATPGNPGTVAVRCTSPPKSSCLNYDPTKGQVSPPAYQTGYASDRLISADDLNAMRGAAKAAGTYYSACPSSLAGQLVFIESGSCTYNSGTFNSLNAPGMLVVATGTITLGGNAIFYGLVYAANLQNSTGYVVSTGGNGSIVGGIAVEGQGGVLLGSAKTAIAFNRNVFNLAKGYGEPAVVKGTWREVVG